MSDKNKNETTDDAPAAPKVLNPLLPVYLFTEPVTGVVMGHHHVPMGAGLFGFSIMLHLPLACGWLGRGKRSKAQPIEDPWAGAKKLEDLEWIAHKVPKGTRIWVPETKSTMILKRCLPEQRDRQVKGMHGSSHKQKEITWLTRVVMTPWANRSYAGYEMFASVEFSRLDFGRAGGAEAYPIGQGYPVPVSVLPGYEQFRLKSFQETEKATGSDTPK